MLNFVEQITNKPEWAKKVFDEAIVAKWKGEALNGDWEKLGITHGDFTKKMFKYVWLIGCQSSSVHTDIPIIVHLRTA